MIILQLPCQLTYYPILNLAHHIGSSLLTEKEYVDVLKNNIDKWKEQIPDGSAKTCWEYVKFKIREFSIHYSKEKAKTYRNNIRLLESQACYFETLLNYRSNIVVEQSYYKAKLKLEEYHDPNTQGFVLSSKIQWQKFGEKNYKCFLNVEKQNKRKSTIRKLNYNGKTVTQPTDIMASIKDYFCKKYERKINVSPKQCDEFLKNIKTPSLISEECMSCDSPITKVKINNVKGQWTITKAQEMMVFQMRLSSK